jgi:peptidoglycan/xylan/chitin deacetylase (PgdA/CDA1 family)
MKIDPITTLLHRQAGEHGPIMLMYHTVTPGKQLPAWPWSVSMQRFCDQLDFLAAEGYVTPTMAELAATPAKAWTKHTAVITFDDGYVNNLAASEELLRRGMRATWFIVSGSMGQSPKWPEDGRPQGRLLEASELRDMQESGMEIGSHTVNHVRLTNVDDIRLMQELDDSKAMLEEVLGKAVSSFAYPYGVWNGRCEQAVKDAGYAAACTTRTGWALRDNNPYQLRRLTVFNTDTTSTFARKLYMGSHDVHWHDIAGYALRRVLYR